MSVPLSPAQLFHVGVVCRDIEAAMAEMSQSLGLSWRGGSPTRMDLWIFGEARSVDMRIAHSIEGPPHVELIQSVPETPWAAPSVGVHHLCYWSDEPAAAIAALQAAGAQRILGKADAASGYFRLPSGALVEILDVETHRRLSGWIRREAA